MPDFSLYRKAQKADEAYQRALVSAHGGRAGDVRYQPGKQSARIKKLRDAKVKADTRWSAEMRKGNPRGAQAQIPRGKWINAKIRVTKDGKVQAQLPRSAVNNPATVFYDVVDGSGHPISRSHYQKADAVKRMKQIRVDDKRSRATEYRSRKLRVVKRSR